MTLKATFGSLAAAGMVAAPVTIFVLSVLLLLPSDSHVIGKIALPILGAGAVFTLGWLVSIPLAIALGGSAYWFLRRVGYRDALAYYLIGPTVGLMCAIIAHMALPDVIGELLVGGWPTFAFLASWCVGGTVLMVVFWRIRRPDRPWDDLADRRRAGEDI
jgi:hypothetical protein